jgi:signal peptidase I
MSAPRILGAALLLALSPLAALHPVRIAGRSMEPALGDGSLRFALRAWCAGAPRVGQVWLVATPSGTVVKRLAAGPGERVEMKDGNLWIDGRFIPEPRVEHPDRSTGGPWDTGPGWFLLGDNRPVSMDSRMFGPIRKEALEARVLE